MTINVNGFFLKDEEIVREYSVSQKENQGHIIKQSSFDTCTIKFDCVNQGCFNC